MLAYRKQIRNKARTREKKITKCLILFENVGYVDHKIICTFCCLCLFRHRSQVSVRSEVTDINLEGKNTTVEDYNNLTFHPQYTSHCALLISICKFIPDSKRFSY